jgi:glutathione S-transferase
MSRAEHPVRLSGRSSSHFTRVAVMFAHELGLDVQLDVVHDLTRIEAVAYGGNPSLRVPTLHLGHSLLFGTENICRKLIELSGRTGDARVVMPEHTHADDIRNAQELVWQAMAAQVQLRVGVAMCGLPADNPFFLKATAGLTGALAWLEEHVARVLDLLPAPRDISLFEVTLFCLVEHVAFCPTVRPAPYPRLEGFAADFSDRDSARRTIFRFDPVPDAPKERS